MFPTALPTRKRRRPEAAFARGREEVKFRDVTLFLVERRMGKSRRNFLSNLARSKGFCVDDALSADVTHVVSEGNVAQELWSWLEEQGFRETCDKHVLHISWFTESMSAGRPVPVEIRHYIQYLCNQVDDITGNEVSPTKQARSDSGKEPKLHLCFRLLIIIVEPLYTIINNN
uniref:DNA nucleotidylexotransferase n=1 Tax=Cyprinus carpio TaxID=7962 RepID=A0A8C2JAF7_CYPCA